MSTFYVEMGDMHGEYTANTEAEALDKFARDADYSSWADACEQGLASDEATTVFKIDTDALISAAPAAVFEDSYGNGVAMMNNVSYASYEDLAQSFGRKVWEFQA